MLFSTQTYSIYFWLLPKPSHNALFRMPELKIGFGYPRQFSGNRQPEVPDPAALVTIYYIIISKFQKFAKNSKIVWS